MHQCLTTVKLNFRFFILSKVCEAFNFFGEVTQNFGRALLAKFSTRASVIRTSIILHLDYLTWIFITFLMCVK